jgi:hypothetical protein
MESGCPGRSFLLSRKFGSHNQRTPAALREPATTGRHRTADSGNPPAIAAAPDTPDMPLLCQTSHPTPPDFWGIPPPRLHTTSWGYLSQANTHLVRFVPAALAAVTDVVTAAMVRANQPDYPGRFVVFQIVMFGAALLAAVPRTWVRLLGLIIRLVRGICGWFGPTFSPVSG